MEGKLDSVLRIVQPCQANIDLLLQLVANLQLQVAALQQQQREAPQQQQQGAAGRAGHALALTQHELAAAAAQGSNGVIPESSWVQQAGPSPHLLPLAVGAAASGNLHHSQLATPHSTAIAHEGGRAAAAAAEPGGGCDALPGAPGALGDAESPQHGAPGVLVEDGPQEEQGMEGMEEGSPGAEGGNADADLDLCIDPDPGCNLDPDPDSEPGSAEGHRLAATAGIPGSLASLLGMQPVPDPLASSGSGGRVRPGRKGNLPRRTSEAHAEARTQPGGGVGVNLARCCFTIRGTCVRRSGILGSGY